MKSTFLMLPVMFVFFGLLVWAGRPLTTKNDVGKTGVMATEPNPGLKIEVAPDPISESPNVSAVNQTMPAVSTEKPAAEVVVKEVQAKIDPVAVEPAKVVNDIPVAAKAAKPVINITAMETSQDPLLKKMAQYEKCCGNAFSRMMIFEYMPRTEAEARLMAVDMAVRLKRFAAAGITPVVSVEPVDVNSDPLSFADVGNGVYDVALKSYFSALKNANVSDGQMGMWVPLPEPNLDEWGEQNRSPADFASAFNRYGKIFKDKFPGAKLSVLIDNETYRADLDDTELVSLVPFVKGIAKGLVDSFGLQGYPWSAPADEDPGTYHDYEAASFLSAARAIEAAKTLGVDSVWFSTGTFSEMFSGDKGQTIFVDVVTRKSILDGILTQVKIARGAGYEAMLLIFAEDKSATQEATNFSYWDGQDSGFAQGAMFSGFIAGAARENILLGIYDSE